MNLEQNLKLILIKCALTELLYCGKLYQKEIRDDKDEISKFKSILMNYYVCKETNWREEVKDLINIFYYIKFNTLISL